MTRPNFELAEVVEKFINRIDYRLLSHHRRTLRAIADCRTGRLGAHLDGCSDCGHLRISYNSCRNRSCPKCQGLNKEMWIVQQEEVLLDVAYFHVVFTLPHELNALCLHNPRILYDLLFKAAWHTLRTLATDPKWLGARSAATMILHTWSQTMILHPHVHCIVPNGGLTDSGNWQFPKRGNGNFLFPVVAMQKIYRGFFMQQLLRLIRSNELLLPTDFPKGQAFYHWKNSLYLKKWVVYTKKPFSGVHQVVNYLARYSHRAALTNHRIKAIGSDTVTFVYKDYRQGAKKRLMTLEGGEFLRRFTLHILPPGFRKIRTYGFCANASKARSIPMARSALGQKQRELSKRAERKRIALQRLFGEQTNRCPCCKKGTLKPFSEWIRQRPPPDPVLEHIAEILI